MVCETPIDLGMVAGDHRLLDVHSVIEQLPDGPAEAIGGDPAKADRPSDDHRPQVITGSFGPFRLSSLPFQFWRVDASKPDSFTGCVSAGVAVVAAANGDGLHGRNRLCQANHQQQG